MKQYEIRECTAVACQFRFPAAVSEPAALKCPLCGAETTTVARPSSPTPTPQITTPRYQHLDLFLDNIRSLYNVGAMMRTADGAGVRHLHLGGITATPKQPKLAKTALGAELALPWTYYRNGVQASKSLWAKGYKIWALEEDSAGESLFQATFMANPHEKILLVIGNEKVGVDPEIMALSNRIFTLPMLGYKNSLNAAVALGIALYHIQFGQSNH